MQSNGNFYLSGAGTDSLSWASGVLTINGAINITGGQAATDISNAQSTAKSATASAAVAQSTANSAASAASTAQSTADTAISRIFTSTAGLINKAATPSGTGLFMDSTYLGFYTGGSWATYMANNGDFYLKGSDGHSGLSWVAASNLLSIVSKSM